MQDKTFKLTYSTMFDPPEELHRRFDEALARVKGRLGAAHPMWVGGRPRLAKDEFECRSPIDRDWLLARLPRGTAADVSDAVAAARSAFRPWASTHWSERVALLRKAAALIEERVYELAAAMALEVGKNRMESLGEVQETADLIAWYCDEMEENGGFERFLPDDPLKGFASHNRTVMKPHGVWAVIAPFNFPMALAGGPVGAALVAGNTVVFKVASDTAWCGALLMDAFRDAGLPDGVVNYLTGSGAEAGRALVDHPHVAGITFTGSGEVGMGIVRTFGGGRWPRPCIAEMGGKNPVVVTRHADLERAAMGVCRSAFGLQGQKCSAASRVLVEKPVMEEFVARLAALAGEATVGDPTLRSNWLGPVINAAALARYRKAAAEAASAGKVFAGGRELAQGDLARGYFVAPTVATAPWESRLWRDEHFLPFVLVGAVDSLDEALARANDTDYGLTAGFYGAPEEAAVFLERIEAGVVYVNRPQGATTGAWPGYQPFGGWKGSGSTGKNIGSFWYLTQYLREQSQTVVE
ncbi:MAG: aldehyde dehydrogenase family protein [Betaproteobacteria bacterium]|nr:aldehyde dehydrogenase family protein [Betaproteobacteria bacterium]PWB57404.1 MAG: 1-pyrroline-5-carboxylate dehydrogenase [Betaproteobacteria bacterium]